MAAKKICGNKRHNMQNALQNAKLLSSITSISCQYFNGNACACVCVCMSTVTSTRWLSGPYKSFSNSMTRLLKNDENFRFTLPGSLAFTVYAQRCTYIHTVSQNKTWNPATFLHNFANTALMRVILGRENRQLILY